MKRLSVVLLTLLITALVVVSCSNTADAADDTAVLSFRIDGESTRSLQRTNAEMDASTLYWHYTAVKKDKTDLTTGQKLTESSFYDEVSTDLPSSAGPFSYGDWEFTLFGYVDSSCQKLAYKGTAAVTVNKPSDTIKVEVTALTNESGYLVVPKKGGIALDSVDFSAAETLAAYVEKISWSQIGETNTGSQYITNETGTTSITLASGIYAVTVRYQNVEDANVSATDPLIVYAEETIYVEVFDNLHTTITGSLSSNTGALTFSSERKWAVVFVDTSAYQNKGAVAIEYVENNGLVTAPKNPGSYDGTGIWEVTNVRYVGAFDHWSLTPGGAAFDFTTPITADTMLYAVRLGG